MNRKHWDWLGRTWHWDHIKRFYFSGRRKFEIDEPVPSNKWKRQVCQSDCTSFSIPPLQGERNISSLSSFHSPGFSTRRGVGLRVIMTRVKMIEDSQEYKELTGHYSKSFAYMNSSHLLKSFQSRYYYPSHFRWVQTTYIVIQGHLVDKQRRQAVDSDGLAAASVGSALLFYHPHVQRGFQLVSVSVFVS